MTDYELYDWESSVAYLGYLIVSIGKKYTLFAPGSTDSFIELFDTIEAAKKAVERFYIEDLVFDLLLIAADRKLITQQQKEAIQDLFDEGTVYPRMSIYCRPVNWVDAHAVSDEFGIAPGHLTILRMNGTLKQNHHYRLLKFGNTQHCQYNLEACAHLFIAQEEIAS